MWEDHLLHRCNNSTKIYYCPEDYQMYGNTDIYNAAPNIFFSFIKKYERMRSYAGKNNLISAII